MFNSAKAQILSLIKGQHEKYNHPKYLLAFGALFWALFHVPIFTHGTFTADLTCYARPEPQEYLFQLMAEGAYERCMDYIRDNGDFFEGETAVGTRWWLFWPYPSMVRDLSESLIKKHKSDMYSVAPADLAGSNPNEKLLLFSTTRRSINLHVYVLQLFFATMLFLVLHNVVGSNLDE